MLSSSSVDACLSKFVNLAILVYGLCFPWNEFIYNLNGNSSRRCSITQGTKGSLFLCLMVFGSFVIIRSVLTENCFGISFSSHHKVRIRSKITLDWRGNEGKSFLIQFCVANFVLHNWVLIFRLTCLSFVYPKNQNQ